MAVYGDMLAFFPEQFRMFDYYEVETKTVAGYTKRKSLGKIKGVMQYLKKGEYMRQNDTLADTSVPTVWTRTKLKAGNLLVIDGEDFRITNNQPWQFQGGFNCYILETFVASKDTQKPMPNVNIGQNSFL